MRVHALRVPAGRWLIASAGIVATLAVVAASAASAPMSHQALTGKKAGHYRVIVLGFDVRNQTSDHALEADGKGDEVYINARVVYTDRAQTALGGTPLSVEGDVTTATMGDRNAHPERIQAGSAPNCNFFGACFEPMGGLRTGDSFPADPIHATAPATPSSPIGPPFVLWDGDLVQGDHSLAIVPSIWEWDGGRDAYAGFVQWLKEAVAKIRTAAAADASGTTGVVLGLAQMSVDLAESFRKVLVAAGDRPLGVQSTWVESSAGKITFAPQVVELNYDKAEMLINQSLLGVPGLISMKFDDNEELHGKYTLYLKIERTGNATDLKPDKSPPVVSVVSPLRRVNGVQLRWKGLDPNIVRVDRTGIVAYEIRVTRGRISSTIRTKGTQTALSIPLRKGEQIAYRIRARDGAGNVGKWTALRTVGR
jgi:hypothetical protein